MNYRAEFVDGVLLGFDLGSDIPFLSQPTWPDGTAWANKAEALGWFDVLVKSFTDLTAPIVGDGPGNHPQPRSVPEVTELPQ
jgi:hypothetical protein